MRHSLLVKSSLTRPMTSSQLLTTERSTCHKCSNHALCESGKASCEQQPGACFQLSAELYKSGQLRTSTLYRWQWQGLMPQGGEGVKSPDCRPAPMGCNRVTPRQTCQTAILLADAPSLVWQSKSKGCHSVHCWSWRKQQPCTFSSMSCRYCAHSACQQRAQHSYTWRHES